MHNLKIKFTRLMHSRFPIILKAVIAFLALWFLFMYTNTVNNRANHVLVHRHAVRLATIHHDNHQIFKYRAQLSAVNDTHMLYIFHHPKLKNHPKYINLTKNMMKTTDKDDGEINNLTLNANYNRAKMRTDHPHTISHNILSPHSGKIFINLVEFGFGMGVLMIYALCMIVKLAFFKYTLTTRNLEGPEVSDDKKQAKSQKR